VAKKRAPSRRRTSKADQEFISEAEEIVERMRDDLADLNDQRGQSDEVDPELVNRIFRSAHSLKALAGMFGFDPIQELAHRMEDILDDIRLGRVSIHSSAVSLIEEAVVVFGSLLEQLGDADAIAQESERIASLTQRIEAARSESQADPSGFGALDLDPSILRALTEYEEHRLRENIERGRNIALVESVFEIISFEEGLSDLSAAIREIGEVLSTLPAPGESPDSEISFSLLAATELSLAQVSERLNFPNAKVRLVLDNPSAGARKSAPEAEAPAEGGEATVDAPAADRAGDAEALHSLKSISDTVRVDIRKLDELMNLVGELVIQRGAIGEIVARLLADTKTARVGSDLDKVCRTLDRKLKGLQASVLDVRMVPLRQMFDKVSRVLRGLRRELDKDVRLDIRGADTELDKLIVEELVDPLMHIVRNALDHALEAPEERSAAGKDPAGCIKVEAFQRGNHVVIAVSDDGRGIDTDRLRSIAVERGLIDADASLSEQEALDLVFLPGVSSRSEVTETSGRGVGMDVVRSNVTALGGMVDIAKTHRVGVCNAMETLLIESSDIQRSEGREMLNLRGEPLLLRRLANEFDLTPPPPDAKQFAVVLGMGDLRIGMLVDSLDGQQDTVIKPIQGPIQSVRGVAGATELGDQDPVLVLDVASFVDGSIRKREAA